MVVVQSGHKLLAPTQSRRSSGDRAAGGGSRINKEEEKNGDTGSTYQHNRLSSSFVEYSLDKQRGKA